MFQILEGISVPVRIQPLEIRDPDASFQMLCRIIPQVPYQRFLNHDNNQTTDWNLINFILWCWVDECLERLTILSNFIQWLDYYHGPKILVWNLWYDTPAFIQLIHNCALSSPNWQDVVLWWYRLYTRLELFRTKAKVKVNIRGAKLRLRSPVLRWKKFGFCLQNPSEI